jgi:hypothetical protein
MVVVSGGAKQTLIDSHQSEDRTYRTASTQPRTRRFQLLSNA